MSVPSLEMMAARNKLRTTSQMQIGVIGKLMALRPRELETIFPDMKLDPLAHSTTARDIQMETLHELEELLTNALHIRRKLIRLGVYLEETKSHT